MNEYSRPGGSLSRCSSSSTSLWTSETKAPREKSDSELDPKMVWATLAAAEREVAVMDWERRRGVMARVSMTSHEVEVRELSSREAGPPVKGV